MNSEDLQGHLVYLSAFLIIILKQVGDIHGHTLILAYCIDCLCFQGLGSPFRRASYVVSVLLLLTQVYQSCLVSYVAVLIIRQESDFIQVMMSFAAILVIDEFDNTMGQWFLSQLSPLKDRMQIRVTGFSKKPAEFMTYPALFNFYAQTTSLIFLAALSAVIGGNYVACVSQTSGRTLLVRADRLNGFVLGTMSVSILLAAGVVACVQCQRRGAEYTLDPFTTKFRLRPPADRWGDIEK